MPHEKCMSSVRDRPSRNARGAAVLVEVIELRNSDRRAADVEVLSGASGISKAKRGSRPDVPAFRPGRTIADLVARLGLEVLVGAPLRENACSAVGQLKKVVVRGLRNGCAPETRRGVPKLRGLT